MFKIGFCILIISFLVYVFFEITLRIYIYKGKMISIDFKTYDLLKKMLKLHKNIDEKQKVEIKKMKVYQYNSIKNFIGIRCYDSKNAYDNFLTLHECGHFISINKTLVKYKFYCISQSVIGINRLIVIPLLFIVFVSNLLFGSNLFENILYLRILLVIFIIATILRVFVGLYEEYCASRIALNFIKNKFIDSIENYARKFYFTCFFSQFFSMLIIVLVIFIMYAMVFVKNI